METGENREKPVNSGSCGSHVENTFGKICENRVEKFRENKGVRLPQKVKAGVGYTKGLKCAPKKRFQQPQTQSGAVQNRKGRR